MAPLGEGFLLRLGKAEVGLGAPQLLDAVIFVGLEQFLGANEAKRVVAFGRHSVLPTFAARERHKRDAGAQAASEIGEQRAVFIVGMRDNRQDAGRGAEALEGLLQISGAAIFWQRECAGWGIGQRNERESALERVRIGGLRTKRARTDGQQESGDCSAPTGQMELPGKDRHHRQFTFAKALNRVPTLSAMKLPKG